MKIVAIVQARMGSTRLPRKMMLNLVGQPVISRIFERIKYSKYIDEAWLATTNSTNDEVLASWANNNKINCFRGSEDDVLDRYYQTAKKSRADVVIRLTGDCPLLDPQIIDKVIEVYKKENGNLDYVSNVHPPTYPDGMDVEVVSFFALEEAWQSAKLKSEREHVTPYIWKKLDLYKTRNVIHDVDLSNYRWTLDTEDDLRLIEKIYREMNKVESFCGLDCILKIVNQYPEWNSINNQYERNEGYTKSIKEEGV